MDIDEESIRTPVTHVEVTTVARTVLIAYFEQLAATEGFAEIAPKLRKAILEDGQFNEFSDQSSSLRRRRMIRIETIRIQDFRGIRDLTLNLKGLNFAACGPNGTGKSGIIDAIEFALTGNISRLLGGGTGSFSVKAHGPHVDSRNKPERAAVTLTVYPVQGRQKGNNPQDRERGALADRYAGRS